MRRLLHGCWPSWLLLLHCSFQVRLALCRSQAHPGFEVLLTASHYWPLEPVDGIHELQETTGAWQARSLTVLPSHNIAFVPTNDSAYSNASATIDIMEGKVNKGIFLKEEKGVTLLYYGRHQPSCLSNPAQCGPEGVTFSFFWKTQGEQSQPTTSAYGGQVISDGFKICSSGGKSFVELYTRDNSMTWEATFSPPGPYWTHTLFTWKSKEGLKVYVNGTLSTADPRGKVSHTYGEPSANLVIGSGQERSRCYGAGAFDEFIIWERALTPEEITLYFRAAVGKHSGPSPTPPSFLTAPMAGTLVPTDAYCPIITNLSEERRHFQNPEVVLNYLQNVSLSLPNKALSQDTAWNLTETFLQLVGELLLLPSWTAVSEDDAVVPGLMETVDTVMRHISSNLHANRSPAAFAGTSSLAEFSVAKLLPKALNFSHYRFPAQGHSYIEIPHKAFHSHAWTTAVGLLYHTMHHYLRSIQPDSTKIAEAAAYQGCLLSAASYLISLEVTPPPTLSQNLSASPLVTVHLVHKLTDRQHRQATDESNRVFLYCAFLDFSSGQGVWSDEGCVLAEGTLGYSVCRCTHLTNFAILMQVVPLELTHGHQVALSSISYIGCSLSVLCLAVTLVTFAMLSSVSAIWNQRCHIHANLSFAILVAQVLLLVSFHCQPGTVPCQVLAVLLQYFFLCVFAWMLVEGLHLYSVVIKVFGSEDSKHRYYYGIGWGFVVRNFGCKRRHGASTYASILAGSLIVNNQEATFLSKLFRWNVLFRGSASLPLLICVVSVSCAVDSYGTRNNCWLSLQSGAIWAFVAPALLVIVVNIGILVAVTRVILQISADKCKVHGDPSAFKLTAKAVAVLLPILGTSWVFGVLAVNHRVVAFQYIFAVLNSLQGFFIFLFHCLLNSEVRAAFKHKTKVWSLSSSSGRSALPKPFSSDVTNGTRPGTASSKLSPWDKSSHSAHRVDLSPV